MLHGESRGYCTKTKQEWPDSGSTLEIFFGNFYEIDSSRVFFLYCKHFGVDGNTKQARRQIFLFLAFLGVRRREIFFANPYEEFFHIVLHTILTVVMYATRYW